MDDLKDFPAVMRQAREDLSANVRGRFSPEDWERILVEARRRLEVRRAGSRAPEIEDWHAVVLDFYRSRYWNFRADYRPPARPPSHRGFHYIWIVFSTFTLTLMGLAWRGQIFSTTHELSDMWILIGIMVLALGNLGFFLWRMRDSQDS